MKLVRINEILEDFINIDFVIRVWKEDDKYFCKISNGSVYRIEKSAYNTILGYG